jgi:hypothetical protein
MPKVIMRFEHITNIQHRQASNKLPRINFNINYSGCLMNQHCGGSHDEAMATGSAVQHQWTG